MPTKNEHAGYFWSGSNRAGEIRALAETGRNVGVSVSALDRGGRALAALLALGRKCGVFEVNVARNGSGSPIIMLCRGRASLPSGEHVIDVGGDMLTLVFRKIAVNVARAASSAKNILASVLRGIFGEDAGMRGAGHRVVFELTPNGWRMCGKFEADATRRTRVFVDSGAFGEVRFSKKHGRMVDVNPISEDEWGRRLNTYDVLASALGDRCYVVAPDKVGDQEETLARLEEYADRLRDIRSTGARVIVPLQRGTLSGFEFDLACSAVLGFDDYVRGIPGNKAASSLSEISALSESLPSWARVHILGIGPWWARYRNVLAALGRPHHLLTSDSVRIKALVGRTNGPGGRPRALTMASDYVMSECGLSPDGMTTEESNRVRYKALKMVLIAEDNKPRVVQLRLFA